MSETKSSEEKQSKFRAVVNDEDQYSIWPIESAIPQGWQTVREGGIEVTGTKEDCLKRIGELWKDMRPRSLREDATVR